MIDRMKMLPFRSVAWLALLLGLQIPAPADTIHLMNGNRLEGTVESENDREVTLRLANGGLRTVKRDQIDRVVKTASGPEASPAPPHAGKAPKPSGGKPRAPEGSGECQGTIRGQGSKGEESFEVKGAVAYWSASPGTKKRTLNVLLYPKAVPEEQGRRIAAGIRKGGPAPAGSPEKIGGLELCIPRDEEEIGADAIESIFLYAVVGGSSFSINKSSSFDRGMASKCFPSFEAARGAGGRLRMHCRGSYTGPSGSTIEWDFQVDVPIHGDVPASSEPAEEPEDR